MVNVISKPGVTTEGKIKTGSTHCLIGSELFIKMDPWHPEKKIHGCLSHGEPTAKMDPPVTDRRRFTYFFGLHRPNRKTNGREAEWPPFRNAVLSQLVAGPRRRAQGGASLAFRRGAAGGQRRAASSSSTCYA